MKGQHRVIVEDKFLKYDFVIQRKITIIKGDSATGKTTLISMIGEAKNNTSVQITCDVDCKSIDGDNEMWDLFILKNANTIFFLDEDCEFVKTKEFADVVKKIRLLFCYCQ